jgi:hypothetical protein
MSWLLSNAAVINDGNGQATVFPVQLPSGVRYWTLLPAAAA